MVQKRSSNCNARVARRTFVALHHGVAGGYRAVGRVRRHVRRLGQGRLSTPRSSLKKSSCFKPFTTNEKSSSTCFPRSSLKLSETVSAYTAGPGSGRHAVAGRGAGAGDESRAGSRLWRRRGMKKQKRRRRDNGENEREWFLKEKSQIILF